MGWTKIGRSFTIKSAEASQKPTATPTAFWEIWRYFANERWLHKNARRWLLVVGFTKYFAKMLVAGFTNMLVAGFTKYFTNERISRRWLLVVGFLRRRLHKRKMASQKCWVAKNRSGLDK